MFVPEGPGPFAVRSSASVEDGVEHSYAGQFATVLDVPREDVPAAIAEVRDSAHGRTARAYAAAIENGEIEMAVMIQDMVRPVVSGVAFSRNPITGLNEVVLEAVTGRGDRLVGGGVTPWRWVRRGDEWIESPTEPTPADSIIAAVADACVELAEAFGRPLDLEWVWDGNRVWYVQARPITGIDNVGIYSNRISREVMPGMIKPLVWSVNMPVVNGAWIDLFTEVLGEHDVEIDDLARQFAYRAYFNMGTIGRIFEIIGMPRDSLEMLLGLPGTAKPSFRPTGRTLRLLPRIARVTAKFARFEAHIEAELTRLEDEFRRLAALEPAQLDDARLLEVIHELKAIGKPMAYLNIVTPLLANLHNSLLRRRLDKHGIDFAQIEVTAGLGAEPLDLDPNVALTELSIGFRALPDSVQAEVEARGLEAVPSDLQRRLEAFLERFGHFSDSGNDFSVAPWHEQPEMILALIRSAPVGRAQDRPAPLPRRFERGRRRAGRYQLHRDAASFAWTRGYGLFRPFFVEAGRRLVAAGRLEGLDDIWYLTHAEVSASLLEGHDHREAARHRRQEMESLADVVMPEVIYGDDFTPTRVSEAAEALRGVPTSRGSHRGTVRVIRGLDEFDRVEQGDIIAIPFSDVGWTPLFSRAGAVVAEAGGVLSHSSIVAREYGIPCVVSVDGAMRLPDGATAVVNGYTGEVVVESG